MSRFTRYYKSWRRREFTANAADPTQVVIWERGARYPHELGYRWGLKINLTASWGVEATVIFLGMKWWSYDNWFFKRLYDWLETRWAEQEYDGDFEDPMGRLEE